MRIHYIIFIICGSKGRRQLFCSRLFFQCQLSTQIHPGEVDFPTFVITYVLFFNSFPPFFLSELLRRRCLLTNNNTNNFLISIILLFLDLDHPIYMSRINIKLIKGRTPGSPVRLDVKLQVS